MNKNEKKPIILIADDNPENIKILSKILQKSNYKVRVAVNGVQVIESVEAEPPDLILMDIQMPKMDGYQASKILKEKENYKNIPIIFVSAMSVAFNKVEAFKVGGSDYITKPFQIEEVLARVKTHIELKRYQDQLQETNIKLYRDFKSTFDQAAVGIIHTNPINGMILKANRRLCNMLGYEIDEILSMKGNDIIHPDFLDAEIQSINKLLKMDIESYSNELKIVRKVKSIVWVKDTVSLVSDINGQPEYLVNILEDISEKKEAEDKIKKLNEELELKVIERTKELESANEELTDANEELTAINEELELTLNKLKETQKQLIESEKMAALGQLVAGVAHEVNTPLGIAVTLSSHIDRNLKHYNEQYLSGKMKEKDLLKHFEKTKESSRIIISNLKIVANLINSFKQISVDQSIQNKRTFNIKEYVEDILLSMNSKLKTTKHIIEIICDKDININSYPDAFFQILTNLINNSLLHGFEGIQEGKILIQIFKKDNELNIIYSDNGIGIEKDKIHYIFDPFYTTKRNKGGTGIGLYIVYNIVNYKLKGTIECNSEISKGTTFEINIPV